VLRQQDRVVQSLRGHQAGAAPRHSQGPGEVPAREGRQGQEGQEGRAEEGRAEGREGYEEDRQGDQEGREGDQEGREGHQERRQGGQEGRGRQEERLETDRAEGLRGQGRGRRRHGGPQGA